MPSKFRGREVGGVLVLGTAYFFLAWACLKLAILHPSASPVWPPAGLAGGALIVLGRRYALAILLGAMGASLVQVDFGDGAGVVTLRSLFFAGMIGIGNMLEALTMGWLVGRFAEGRRCLERAGTVFSFVLCAVFPPLISAGFGVSSISIAGVLQPEMRESVLLTWYTGNITGMLTVAPLIVWFGNRRPVVEPGRGVESLVQVVSMIALGAFLWGFVLPASLEGLPQIYMGIPLVLWAAFRLGRGVTLVSIVLLSSIAIGSTVAGLVPFPGPSANHSLIYLQIYIGLIVVMGLAVGALVAELRATNEGLEEAVKERTVRLERLLRDKDEFFSFMVHELQIPLVGLRNLLGLVRSNPGSIGEGSGAKLVEEMESAADSMLGQVGTLLENQRANEEEEGQAATMEELGALLEECVRVHRPNAVAKDIKIEVKLPPDPFHACTVRQHVEHILGNLISNAVKFTPAGRGVRARLTRENGWARFEIEDEGPGIPAEEQASLFEKFQRSTAEPTGGESSTGLGLFIVGRMVRELGGKIRCQSEAGRGARFIVDIPAREG